MFTLKRLRPAPDPVAPRSFINFSASLTSFFANENRGGSQMSVFVEPFMTHVAFAALLAAWFSTAVIARSLIQA